MNPWPFRSGWNFATAVLLAHLALIVGVMAISAI